MNDRPVSRPLTPPVVVSPLLVATRAGAVSYDELGAGAPLVLLPSGGHDRRDWDAVRPALAAHFRTIAVDWPGHGGSPLPDPGWTASAAGFADLVEDVLDAVAPEPVAVLGNSVGGYAAARLAIRRPDRVWALVLVDSGGFVPMTPRIRLFNTSMGRPALLRAFYPRFARRYMRADTDFAARVESAATANARRPGTTEVLSDVWRSFSTPAADLTDAAGAITAPTLAVWGRRDPVLPPPLARRLVAAIPGARLTLLDTGHVPFASRPDEFVAAVLPFLHEADAARH